MPGTLTNAYLTPHVLSPSEFQCQTPHGPISAAAIISLGSAPAAVVLLSAPSDTISLHLCIPVSPHSRDAALPQSRRHVRSEAGTRAYSRSRTPHTLYARTARHTLTAAETPFRGGRCGSWGRRRASSGCLCAAGCELDVKGSGVLRYNGSCLGSKVFLSRSPPIALGFSVSLPLVGPSEGLPRGPLTVGH